MQGSSAATDFTGKVIDGQRSLVGGWSRPLPLG
jgi:hypothetical protein